MPLPKIKTNELKKGMWVELACGWVAQVADNKRGNIRMCDVYGLYHEMGSVYSHDIVAKLDTGPGGGTRVAMIEYTPAQEKLRKQVSSFGW